MLPDKNVLTDAQKALLDYFNPLDAADNAAMLETLFDVNLQHYSDKGSGTPSHDIVWHWLRFRELQALVAKLHAPPPAAVAAA